MGKLLKNFKIKFKIIGELKSKQNPGRSEGKIIFQDCGSERVLSVMEIFKEDKANFMAASGINSSNQINPDKEEPYAILTKQMHQCLLRV